MKRTIVSIVFMLSCLLVFSQTIIERDFKKHFEKFGVEGCFVLYDQNKDEYIKYNPDMCDQGYMPASTFKIPHALIALEEKLVAGIDDTIKWNGHEWPHKVWNQDQTLATSMKYSCIWVYFGFAEKLGIKKYNYYVESFDYGNKNLKGPPTRFWLAGEFRISANQQIEFLKKFYNGELGVSQRNTELVKGIIVLEDTENYTWRGKTGGGDIAPGEHIMWLVGYLETKGNVYFYAMNFIAADFASSNPFRKKIVENIFRDLGLAE